MPTLERRYVLVYTGNRTFATSDAGSFGEALERAKMVGLSPEDFRYGERYLGRQVTRIDIDKPLCPRTRRDDSVTVALVEQYLGSRVAKN